MKRNIRVLIVEDEFITLDLLKESLLAVGYDIAGDAMSAEEAITILEQGAVDIAILDINIKGKQNGIWLATQIREKYNIPFIFLSAYSDKETIEKASEVLPYAYLVKPFNKADLFAAIEIALKNFASILSSDQKHDEIEAANYIFVKDNLIYKKININEIRYIEAFANYLELHFDGYRVVVRSTLQSFLAQLPQNLFLQPHRSFIINSRFVEIIGNDFIMIGTKKIPLSKSHKAEFSKHFNFFN